MKCKKVVSLQSEKVMNKIGQKGELLEEKFDSKVKPNIILIQLESFFDTNEIEALLNVDNSVYCSEMIAVYEIEN